jgi:carbon-monoxide dehydrogenase medium subunit
VSAAVAPAGVAYAAPGTLAAALDLLREPGAVPLAGGTDLVVLRASGAVTASALVDLKRIDALRGVERRGGATRVGAATTMADLAPQLGAEHGALADGAGVVGAPQTRNRATLGGNVCRSSPAGDTLAPLVALDAVAHLRSDRGSRAVPLRELFTGPGRNVLRADELLVAVELPHRGGASAYRRRTYRAWMDLAVVGVAVQVRTDGDGRCVAASVALGGAAPTPTLVPAAGHALVGSAFEPDAQEEAGVAVRAAARPIDDVRGSRRHRLHAAGVLTRRVLAHARAREAELRP